MERSYQRQIDPFEFQSELDDTELELFAELADQEWEQEFGRRRRIPIQRAIQKSKRPRRPPARPKRRPPQPGWSPVASYEPASAAPVPEPEGSEYVRWVQTMLNQALNLQLPIDGIMRVQTRSTIRSFQEKNGLPVTGVVGPDTERALLAMSASNPTAPAEPPPLAKPEEQETFLGSWWPFGVGDGAQIEDRTVYTPKSKRVATRDPKSVYALVLHQMAFSRGNDPKRYDSVTAHYAILPDGKIIQLHPISAHLNASNGFNSKSVAVEFAGNFPNTKGKCWEAKRFGCHTITQAQIDAGRKLIRHLIETNGLTHVLAHRQSSHSRENDPGPDIWYHVGQWAVENLGLKDGGPGFKVDSGNPIPDVWRNWGRRADQSERTQAIASEFEAYDFEADASAWESETNRSSRDYIKWVQRSLNQIMGLNLTVDGAPGPQTRSAIRSFQQRKDLKADGNVGTQTERALIAAGASPLPGTRALVPSFVVAPARVQPKMAVKPGFGNRPQSFGLRVRIVGYASPRWRGAKNAIEADRLNFTLSTKRADTVRALVEKELRGRLGNNIKIEYAVSEMEPRNPQGIEIGSYGVGSVDALAAARGNRKDNSEINRRVEVMIEKINTTYTTGGVSLPPQRVAGFTDSWALGVTKLRMLATGPALGSIEVVLRNRRTNKQMFATADIYGGGLGGGTAKAGGSLQRQIANAMKNNLIQAVDDFIGRGEVFFTTKQQMGFDDFDGQLIRIGKATGSLGIKAVYAYAVFPFISHHPDLLVFQKKITIGLLDLEGWVATGKLHLRGPNPGDWSEYDRTDQVQGSYDTHWMETLVLTFPTGKWELLPADKSRLTDFVAIWARRYLESA